MFNTTLASRLNCTHCVFTRDQSDRAACKRRFYYAEATLTTPQLCAHHALGVTLSRSDHVPMVLATIIYKYRTTFWAASFVLQLPWCSYIEIIFDNCQNYATKRQGKKPCEEAVHGGNAEQ